MLSDIHTSSQKDEGSIFSLQCSYRMMSPNITLVNMTLVVSKKHNLYVTKKYISFQTGKE